MPKVIHTKSKIISVTLILLFSILAYKICRVPTSIYAEVSKNSSVAFSINDETYLNLALSSNNVALNLQPTAAGQFGKVSMTIGVDTNNTTGYNLTMTADTTSLSRSTAVNGANYQIPTLAEASTCNDETSTTCDNFPIGYWGYKLGTDNSTYLPMTTNTESIRLVKGYSSVVDNTTLTFGTKLSNSVPTGVYNGVNLTFVAVTNYAPSITYLQEMDQTIADSMVEGFTYTLRDIRDEQDYTVAKLKDGKIWMTENLNLAGGITVTPNDSNVESNYTLPASEQLKAGSTWQVADAEAFTDNTKAYVFNSGSRVCKEDTPCYSYYSFAAATALSGNTVVAENADAPYSICPKGWRMPTARAYTTNGSEYYGLGEVYGFENGPMAFYNNIGPGTIPNFVPNGWYGPDNSGWVNLGIIVWSSTSFNTDAALHFNAYSGEAAGTFDFAGHRKVGIAVRCVFD